MSTTFRDNDVQAIFADAARIGLAVDATIDGLPGTAFFDSKNEVVLSEGGGHGAIVGSLSTVTVQSSAWPTGTLAEGKRIVIGGKPYTIRQVLGEGDNALTELLLGSI